MTPARGLRSEPLHWRSERTRPRSKHARWLSTVDRLIRFLFLIALAFRLGAGSVDGMDDQGVLFVS